MLPVGSKSILALVILFLSRRLLYVPAHRHVWLDFVRGSFTTVWSMWVLVLFGNSAMRRGLLQEPAYLNHIVYLVAASRHHGDHGATAATAAAAAITADVDDDSKCQHRHFLFMALFDVHHAGKRDSFMPRMRALQAAFAGATSWEGLGLSSSATSCLCFLLKYCADDSLCPFPASISCHPSSATWNAP